MIPTGRYIVPLIDTPTRGIVRPGTHVNRLDKIMLFFNGFRAVPRLTTYFCNRISSIYLDIYPTLLTFDYFYRI